MALPTVRRAAIALATALIVFAAALAAYNGTHVTPLVLSRETTFITGPLRADGTPDYVGFLNAKRGKDVTGDNNAAPALQSVKLVGTTLDSAPLASALIGRFEPWPADFDKTYREQMRRSRVAPWRAVDAPLAAAWLHVNETELRRIDEVVATRSRWWNPLPTDLCFDTTVPSLLPVREMANAYRTRTMSAISSGNEDEAVQTTAAALRYAALFDRGSLLDRLVGIAVRQIVLEPAVVLANPPPRRLATAERLLAALKALPTSPPLDDVIQVDERLAALANWSDLYRAARQSPAAFQQRLGDVVSVYEQVYSGLGAAPPPPNLRHIPAAAVDWNELFRKVNACWGTDACAPDLTAAKEDLHPVRFEVLRVRALLFPDARRRMARALRTLESGSGLSRSHISWGEQEAEARLALVSAAAAVARLSAGRYPADPSTLTDLAGLDPRADHAGYRFQFTASQGGRSFACTATPTRPGETGVRRFCADSTGRVASGTGESLLVQDGVCSPGLQTLAARVP